MVMLRYKRLILAALVLTSATAWGQAARREPHIGYVYPAGGQTGAVVEVVVGGQTLRGADRVFITGEGVRGEVVKYYPPLGNIKKEEYDELVRVMKELREKRLAEKEGRTPNLASLQKPAETMTDTGEKAELPKHPLLYNLEKMSLRQLDHVQHEIVYYRRRQMNSQIAESVMVAITIDPAAAPGPREIRIGSPAGLTNPMRFEVATLPEVRELEPNEAAVYTAPVQDPAVAVPVIFNGQIQPGDVDRLKFRARKGQKLVLDAEARQLIPYLADAVPGWFQATMTLFDSHGHEMAFADDYGFSPDPVLLFDVPKDDNYEVEIRDSIFRGRDDFVYRVAVSEQPFVTQFFPLGGSSGTATIATLAGWNLTTSQLRLETSGEGPSIRETNVRQGGMLSNAIAYEVDSLAECLESEPNDTTEGAQRIELPRIVNGRIRSPGDVDVFAISGHGGDEVVAEVTARRLGSPMDSLLRISDAAGSELASNDDFEDKGMGLLTHHADSYVRVKLPSDGTYFVALADSQRAGGEAYTYRLRISAPRPDFALRVTPSSVIVPAGRAATICVHVLRKDGFDGPIDVRLANAPKGLELDGGQIPEGRESMRMTLTAAMGARPEPFPLEVEGRARMGEETVRRTAVPAEDMMQAFIYRHLTPSQAMLVSVPGSRFKGRTVELAGITPVRIPLGGTAEIQVKTPKYPGIAEVRLDLIDPPAGISMGDVTAQEEGLTFALKADGAVAKAGDTDNVIVEAYMPPNSNVQDKTKGKRQQRVSLGVLPAIPVQVVEK